MPDATNRNQDPTAMPVLAGRAAPAARTLARSDAMMWTLVTAALLLTATGTIFHGPRALLLAGVSGLFSILAEAMCCRLWRMPWTTGMAHSIAMGLIVGLMLPATAPWYVAGTGALATVVVGKWLMGGLGHYPWNPAAVAIIVLYLLWPEYITPQQWPLLSRDHVVVGNGLRLGPLANTPALPAWASTEPAGQAVGFTMTRADVVLQAVAATGDTQGRIPLEAAVRDLLPSWWDMLIGAVAGPIGAGSILALVFVGLVLIWRGYLDWTLPLAVLCGAFGAAAVMPLAETGWWPITYSVDGTPYGLLWVAYHVLLGPTLFAAVMLAGETVTRPMARRGQIVYGLGIGALTVALRWWPTAALSGCWAVLAMNTLVPIIERLDRRR